jgi:uncharacterized protein (TIGR02679 family)
MSGVRDPARLRPLLGTDAWRWWRERVRTELEAGRPIPATITRKEPTEAEREAANRLFGTPGDLGPVRIRSAELELMLREAAIANDIASCIVALDGPLVDRAAQRTADAAAWNAVYAETAAALAPLCPSLSLQKLLESGLLRRLSVNQPQDARQLVGQTVSVMTRLRAGRSMHLAELSAVATGDAHALDRDHALGLLVLRLTGWSGDGGVLAWKSAWASLGVLVHAVSASTLTLNLQALGDVRLARICESMRGEPLRLTARQIDRKETAFSVRGRTVFVCENPTVIAAAADALGEQCPTIVCVDGRATTPSLLLLRQLERDGATLRYQGDGDWPGIEIAADLRRHVRLQPWRLTAHDLPFVADRPGPPLEGQRIETPWDPPLADALVRRGRALHEETVLDLLLGDLRVAASEKDLE